MMKIKFFLYPLAVVWLILTSCADPDKIQVGGVEIQGYRLFSTSAANVDVGLEVTNASGSKAAVTDARAEISMDGAKIADVALREKVVVPHRSEGVYTLPFQVRINGLTGLMLLGGLDAETLDRCTVNARVTLRGGWAKKSFSVNDISLTTLLRQLGVNPQDFLERCKLDR